MLAVEAQAGYWVYCLDRDTPLVTGPAAPTTVSLRTGWNLVGAGWDALLPDDPAIAGLAWGWDALLQTYSAVLPGDRLPAGRAYWIFCTAPVSLALPPAPAP